MITQRWQLLDVETGETYTVPINPDSMSSPTGRRSYSTAAGGSGGQLRTRTMMAEPGAIDWEFGGVIRTREHHDTLEYWADKPGKVRVTDHLNRTYEVVFSAFRPVDRPPKKNTPWRLRYTMTALLLRRIS